MDLKKIENLIRDRNQLFERFAEKIEQTQLKTERFNRNDNCSWTRGQELSKIKERAQKNDSKTNSNMESVKSSSQIFKIKDVAVFLEVREKEIMWSNLTFKGIIVLPIWPQYTF